MSGDAYRHHRAGHAPQPSVIFVEVPVGGSPETARQNKPPRYPHQDRQHWRPQRSIPSRGKAEGLKRLLDYMRRQDEIVREFMRPDAKGWLAWLGGTRA
jgi:hypothetical protein